jgi:putative transposase
MIPGSASYPRHWLPAEIINHSVWLYHVFSLSLRDVALILAERGILVTHESIRHRCLKFGADFAGDGRSQETPGISTKCSSASAAR